MDDDQSQELQAEEFEKFFKERVSLAAKELFEGVEPPFKEAGNATIPLDQAAVIGFVCPEFRGAFFMGTTGEKLKARFNNLYQDWIGELTNQLAGRVKNILARVGLAYDFSPPLTLSGNDLSVAMFDPESQLTYTSSEGDCQIGFLLKVRTPIAFRPVDATEQPMDEGDFVVF